MKTNEQQIIDDLTRTILSLKKQNENIGWNLPFNIYIFEGVIYDAPFYGIQENTEELGLFVSIRNIKDKK